MCYLFGSAAWAGPEVKKGCHIVLLQAFRVFCGAFSRVKDTRLTAIDGNPAPHLELFQSLCRRGRQFLTLTIFLWSTLAVSLFPTVVSAQVTPPYPVIFVHGINDSGSTFQTMKSFLDPTGVLTGERLIAWKIPSSGLLSCSWSHDWSSAKPTWTPISGVGVLPAARRYFAIDFSSNNDLTLSAQGKELKQVIDCVIAVTGQAKVILVAHSMGGLAARAYLQGGAGSAPYLPSGAGGVTYGGDVAKLITIGTPHQGSPWPDKCQQASKGVSAYEASISAACGLAFGASLFSVGMEALKPPGDLSYSPGASTSADMYKLDYDYLGNLPTISYASIIVTGAKTPFDSTPNGDGIVTETSQNLISLGLDRDIVPIVVPIDTHSCPVFYIIVQSHTCELQNTDVQDKIKTEILNTPLPTPQTHTLSVYSKLDGTSSSNVSMSLSPSDNNGTTHLVTPSTSSNYAAYNVNQSVTITAPSSLTSGAQFTGWGSGCQSQSANNCTVTMDVECGVTALYSSTPGLSLPTLISPGEAINSTHTAIPYSSITFNWNKNNTGATYNLYVRDITGFADDVAITSGTLVINGQNVGDVSSYTWTGAQASKKYRWQVDAVKSGSTVSSDKWVFVTQAASVDVTPPSIAITSPVASGQTYNTSSGTVNVSGTASDNVGVLSVVWSNDRGGGGTASGTTSWSVTGIGLQSGLNTITVHAYDAAGNNNLANMIVNYTAPVTTINGACGSVNGGTFAIAPANNLCSAGTATSVSGSGPWTWSCNGSNGGSTASCSAAKTIQAAPVITSAGTANGTVSQSFSYPIIATNSPTSYGASGLPAWLSINPNTGQMSGTPTASGTFNVAVTATNAGGTGSMTVTITIAPASSSRYTKIANSGAALSDSAVLGTGPSNWACTRDNTSGLIWEVKTADGGLRDLNNSYTNLDDPTQPQKRTNSGFVSPTQADIDASGNSIGFAKAVRSAALCGYNDWRMPSKDELLVIVDISGVPTINTTFFPNTPSMLFWSGSPLVGVPSTAWYVYFGTGNPDWDGRDAVNRVRLVSTGQTLSTFALTVSTGGGGSGTVSSNPSGIDCGVTCSANYNSGTSVTLTATPTAGSTFNGWSGACTGTGSCVMSMSAAQSVSASFALITYSLSVTKSGTGSGTVSSSPAGINCGSTCTSNFTSSTSVTLSATAATGSSFAGWSGGGCSGTGSCAVTMNAAQNVTATFTLVPVSLPSCTLTATPASISAGSSSTLTANCSPAATSYTWSGGSCAGTTGASCTVTPAATTTYTVAGSNSGGNGTSASATVTVTTSSGGIPASERAVLVNLYNSTNGASWINNTGWMGTAGTECTWYGVTCDGSQSHVNAISLASNHLVGTLPSLSGLTALQVFVVNNNQLTGSIPSLSGLTALQTFSVGHNQLSGSIPSLSGLTALRFIEGDINQLTGSIPSLSGLTALQTFSVGSNQLTGSIPSLSGLTALHFFEVAGNRLTGLIPSLSGLTALLVFDVQANQLTGSIPSISGLTALQLFIFQNNQLTGSIPSLSGLTALQFFVAAGNQLTGPAPTPPTSLVAGRSTLCGNSLFSSGNSAIDAAWVTATGVDWLACQAVIVPPVCTLTANPASIFSGGSTTLAASCTPAATSYAWTGGSCAGMTGANCTVTPTATTTYTVAGSNSAGAGASASATVTVAVTPPVFAAGLYDGIYQWSSSHYLSIHQHGSRIIATIYFNDDGSFNFNSSDSHVLPVPQLDVFDLLNGPLTGSKATISGTRFHRTCNETYDFAFSDSGSITVTKTGVSNTAAADLAGISCAAITDPIGTVLIVPKILF